MRTQSNLCAVSSVPALITDRVQYASNAVALECEGQVLTYGELERWSNRLARILRAQGVKRDVLVGLLAERSLGMVVSAIGILKAGGAYVPLDPKHGKARIRQILQESQPGALIGTHAFF